MEKEALRVIDRIYPNLRELDEVKHYSEENEGSKFELLENYFSSLETLNERVKANPKYSEERIRRLKEIYYKWCLIKRENVPESVYEREERLVLERGFGHIKVTDEAKKEIQNEIIENQKKSLDVWIDYFISEDSKFYPFWAKYWAFRGMLSLGYYNKEEGTYNKRSETTTAPFAELNREALGITIDLFIKSIGKEKIENDELEKLVKTNSFQKIYLYSLNKLNNIKNINNSNEGIWIKYDKGSDPTALVNSLKGKNTGWCTAGESIAKEQLSNGDFYVYYTLDNNNEYKNPRIAIRMEEDSIGEIRGIGKDQNIEQDMEKVLEEKLQEFPDKDLYYKKVNDMKMMTKIYKKYQEGIELTIEELRFLYEIDSKIEGFGFEKDPRIDEIKKSRKDIKRDFARMFNCEKSQVAISKSELTEKTLCYIGNLNFSKLKSCKNTYLPKFLYGSLYLDSLVDTNNLHLPEHICGDLFLRKLKKANNLVMPKHVGGNLILNNISSIDKGLILPEYVGGILALDKLLTARGLVLPKYIGGNVYLSKLVKSDCLIFPLEIGGDLELNSIENIDNFVLPKKIKGDLELSNLTMIEPSSIPKYVGGYIFLNNLKNADNLVFPKKLGGLFLFEITQANNLVLPNEIEDDLLLPRLKTLKGTALPKIIKGHLNLKSLESKENLVFPNYLGHDLYLDSLKDGDNIIFPKKINGSVHLDGLESAKGTVFPTEVNGDLFLRSLKNMENVSLPEYIKDSLNLPNLENIKNVKFPKHVGDFVVLSSLKKIEDEILPETIGGYLHLYMLESASNVIFPRIIKGDLNLDSLKNVDNVVFPKKILGTLRLDSLEMANGIVLPEHVGKSLNLTNLISVNGITISKYVGGSLEIGVTSAKNLVLPDFIGYTLYLPRLKNVNGLKLPEHLGGHLFLNRLETDDYLDELLEQIDEKLLMLPPSISLKRKNKHL